LLFGGLCCIFGTILFASNIPALRKKIRPVYAQKGIIPEVAKGLQSAAELGGLAKD
jgi:hypothetical protein